MASSHVSSAFAGFRFPAEVISVAVRWYLRYGLSYRDVEDEFRDAVAEERLASTVDARAPRRRSPPRARLLGLERNRNGAIGVAGRC
jgi:transposase-like protein